MRFTALALASLSLLTLAACDSTPASLMMALEMQNERTDEVGMTTSDVALVLRDPSGQEFRREELGSYGGCGTQTAPEDGPLLTLTCWFAGSGDEFQVRMDGTDTLAIDHRIVDAEAEIPEFETLKTVTIPEGTLLLPVVPTQE